MSLLTRAIPGMFGGVSQQIPAMRHATQCSEQDNGLATLVDGLYKRPGSQHLFVLPLTGANGASVSGSYGAAYGHVIEQSGALYQLVLVNGNLMLYSMASGAAQSVTFPNGRTYLNVADPETEFRCITVADYTFIVNTGKTVAMQAATGSANPTNVAYIQIKTAVPKTSYSAVINGVSYTITAGDTPTSDALALSLAQKVQTDLGAQGYTALSMAGNIVKITKASGTFTCTAHDGWANQATQTIHQGVDKFSDLPATFETGYVVSITGTAESAKDTYYVTWDNGRWVETKKPLITTRFDATTMPHQLRPDGAGGWIFEQVPNWGERLVGDDDTNPEPSFVGERIRGAFFFRNRLGFLSRDSVVLSRAGQYFNFWGATATQVLDTDPIDLGATSEQVESLDWAVVYNQSLLVWASNRQQFVLAGGDILSPNNARLQPSTTFETYNGAKPVPMGNRILFASNLGTNAQINLYKVSEDTVTNTAEDLSEHVPKYIPGAPRQLVASTTVKMAVVVPRGVSKELVLFKYEADERDVMTQRAWGKLKFETSDAVRLLCAHWAARKLYLLKHVTASGDPVAGGRFHLEVIDFDEQSQDTGADFALRLDNRAMLTPVSFDGTNTLVDVPYLASQSELVLLKCAVGVEPEQLTIANTTLDPTNLRTRVNVSGNHMGATVWAGRKFTFRYVFTEVFLRDADGVPIIAASVKLVRMLVRYVSTGWFKAKVTPLLRSTYEYPFSGRTIGMPGQGPQQLALSTGEFSIPVNFKAASTEVVLESDSYLPCKFPYAEWVGDITMKAQR